MKKEGKLPQQNEIYTKISVYLRLSKITDYFASKYICCEKRKENFYAKQFCSFLLLIFKRIFGLIRSNFVFMEMLTVIKNLNFFIS